MEMNLIHYVKQMLQYALISAYDLWYVLIYIGESAKEFQFNMLPDIDTFILLFILRTILPCKGKSP